MKRTLTSLALFTSTTLAGCSTEVGGGETVATASEAVYEMSWVFEPVQILDAALAENFSWFSIRQSSSGGKLCRDTLGGTYGCLGRPGDRPLSRVAAVKNGSRYDVFVVANNKKIYHRFEDGSSDGWSDWHEIVNHPTVLADSPIAVTSWGPGRLDLFWWTPSRNLGHAWATEYQWRGLETGDSSNKPHLQPLEKPTEIATQPDLTAVSWGPDRIDVFFRSNDIKIGHHWYDRGWSAATREIFEPLGEDRSFWAALVLNGLAVSSRGPNQLELFLSGTYAITGGETKIWRTVFDGSWKLVHTNALEFERVAPDGDAWPTARIDSAIHSREWEEMDLVGPCGTGCSGTWAAYDFD